ncbi:lipopolysaccharide biosynthesis protein [Arthrobacter sp. MPF02]|uniref:lipopolysaccharide biosynthesis protein n=1 Tax=Arthrobacter sp. MPF02 TaxID=3388492 RepID=UPI003985230C
MHNSWRRGLSLARDVLFVSLGRYGQYVVTLATVPLCARILGVEGTGMLAIATSAYFFGSIIVDFGLSQILAGRVSREESAVSLRLSYAKLRLMLLAPLLLLCILAISLGWPPVAFMISIGLLAGGLSSAGEEWVLLGYGEFGRIAAYQVLARCIYLASLFVALPLVQEPWTPMLCLAFSTMVSAGFSWYRVGSIRTYNSPRIGITELVRVGSPAVGARMLTSAYSQGATVYYSTVVPVAALGVFSAGEKIVRAASAALDALGLALLPRMAGALRKPTEFWSRAERSALGSFLFGCVAAALMWIAAPLAVRILYGPDFAASIPILRWLVLLMPAAAVSSMIMTSVLYVREDSKGVLLGACIGVVAGAAGFTVTWIQAGSLTVMVASIVTLEWIVAGFYVSRLFRLKKRDISPGDRASTNGHEEHKIT